MDEGQIYVFLFCFFVGIFISWWFYSKQTIILKYPKKNSKNVYKDDEGVCYTYEQEDVDCEQHKE